jgi:hypothetical protein
MTAMGVAAEQIQLRIFQRMTPAERLDCCFRWTRLTCDLARATVRSAHPDWSPGRVSREVGRRLTGIDLSRLAPGEGADEASREPTAPEDRMTTPDEIPSLIARLEQVGAVYALTGSLASAAWGRPRATYDADVLIDLSTAHVDRLLAAFPEPSWYADRRQIKDALASGGEFNIIHGASGTKIDFWIKHSEADAQRLARRRRERVAGVDCWLLSPEDTILAKLEWLAAAPSERQKHDVAGVLAVQADRLDMAYLTSWSDRLGVRALLDQARAGAWDRA